MESNDSKVVNLYANETIMQEAAAWLVKMDDGLTQAQLEEFEQWKSRSGRHADVFEQMRDTLDEAEVLSSLAEVFPLQRRKGGVRFHSWSALASAALFCLVMLPLGYIGVSYLSDTEVTDASPYLYSLQVDAPIATSVKKQLQDGSVLTLNSNSSVLVRYTAQSREIVLTRGELHIEVKHNPSRPLFVNAGNQRFEAVGTAFNVAMHESDVELIVTDGKVKAAVATSFPGSDTDITHSSVNSEQTVQVVKGERLQIRVDTHLPTAVMKSQMDEVQMAMSLSWREGIITFNGEPLTDVISQLERYTGKQFVIKDESLKNLKIVARFKMQELDDILSVMEKNMGINASKDTNRSELIVLNSAK